MKRTIFNFVVTVLVVALSSREVYAKAALAQVRIQVVDQDGCIVPGAKIWGGFTCGPGMNDFVEVDGITDTNGMYVAQGKCNEFLRFEVRKEGYYLTEEKIFFGRSKADPIIADGKWQPYGETMEVVLKKIKNPIRLQMPGRCSAPIPVCDQWVGFDLERKQWVSPYGDGRYADVLLRFGRFIANSQTDFRLVLEVSFTNSPYAGFYQRKKNKSSEFQFEYQANSNAIFCAEAKYTHERHPNAPRIDDRLDGDSYLIFRTRTSVDEHGDLRSAHYGIINGKWSFFDTLLSDGYYFNSTPNDTNLEDAETARKSRLGYKQSLEFGRRRKAGGK